MLDRNLAENISRVLYPNDNVCHPWSARVHVGQGAAHWVWVTQPMLLASLSFGFWEPEGGQICGSFSI